MRTFKYKQEAYIPCFTRYDRREGRGQGKRDTKREREGWRDTGGTLIVPIGAPPK